MGISRKSFLTALAALPLAGCASTTPRTVAATTSPTPRPRTLRFDDEFRALESRYGARLGVQLLDTETGATVSWRPDDRFAFCSTHKAFTGAAVLRNRDAEGMQEVIHYTADDLVAHSPVTSEHVDTGMTLDALCQAAIRVSDNTAANLLFAQLDGPAGFQRILRDLGDDVTRSDRIETDLNTAVSGDDRDTTTPRAWATTLQTVALGSWLAAEQRATLAAWMSGNAVTDTLIRAGVSADWHVADKSGGGDHGTRNDIGVLTRDGRKPVVLAIMSTKPDSASDAGWDDALIADAARTAMVAVR